jgi:ATP-dependent DNA ligase
MARSAARQTAAALPAWIRPQLTQLAPEAPEGPEWLHEIKFDGYRMHARLDRGAVRLLTRTGLDWTHKYPALATSVSSLDARQAYLDGVTLFALARPVLDIHLVLLLGSVAVLAVPNCAACIRSF